MEPTAVEPTVTSQAYVNKIGKSVRALLGAEEQTQWKVLVCPWTATYTNGIVHFGGWNIEMRYKDAIVASTPRFPADTDPFGWKVRREIKKMVKRAKLVA